MKKVLFLHAGSEMYGADKVMLDLIKNIDKIQYMPYVILPQEGVLAENLTKINIKVEIVPYPILRRKYFNIYGIIKYIVEYFKYSRKLLAIAKKEHIDIIHNNTSAVLEGCYISKRLNIPLIWVVHEIIIKPKFIFKIICKIIASYSTKTVAVSNSVKKHLESSGYFKNGMISVIYNGIDIHRFNKNNCCDYLYEEWKIPKNAKIIGMLGRVNSWKGQHDLLEAANILMKKNKNLYTIIVGSVFKGEEWREQQLQMEILSSPFRERIIFEKYRVDSEHIHNLFDIFILPSINPEPLPTVVLEAMASGKPVIGYRHGGVCEMVLDGYNGFLVDVCDYKALADKIEFLLNDEVLLKQMGENSLKRLLELFSMSRYVNSFLREYNLLIKEKTSDKKNYSCK